MAGSSLLALIDDIASVLDDVAAMTKVAAKKTSGVLGDDLALNAQQLTGIRAAREAPVVWAVARGSLKNKAILVPAALIVSALTPWLVLPLLMIGGAFLCYEGFEKLIHKLTHRKAEDRAHHDELVKAVADPAIDMVAFEKEKIKGAVRTDLILSAEIIVITLGTVAVQPIGERIVVLSAIALIMTIGVYGFVAAVVKLDDGGLYLSRRQGDVVLTKIQRGLGRFMLRLAPYLMKTLSIAGTAAMFMVGGGILAHGLPGADELVHTVSHTAASAPMVGGLLNLATSPLINIVTGIFTGAVVLSFLKVAKRAGALVSKI